MLAVVDVKKVEGRIESLWPAEKTEAIREPKSPVRASTQLQARR